MPLSGSWPPNGLVSLAPIVVVILTTAGPAFAAASITADDSSIVTGCWAPVCWVEPVGDWVMPRSSAPVRSRTTRGAAGREDRGQERGRDDGADAGAGAALRRGARGRLDRRAVRGRRRGRGAAPRRSCPGRRLGRAPAAASGRPAAGCPARPTPSGRRVGDRASGRSGGRRRVACRPAGRCCRRPGGRPVSARRSWGGGSSLWLVGRFGGGAGGGRGQGCLVRIHRRGRSR